MAVYTKLRHKRLVRLYADPTCYRNGELFQVWTLAEGERTPFKRLLSDLIADRGLQEIFEIIRAETKVEDSHHARIRFCP